MGLDLVYSEDATEIDPNEAEGLIPSISTMRELNSVEAANIAAAIRWAETSRTFRRELLTEPGLRRLHRRMFDRTWRWAGRYRHTQKSIGIEAWRVGPEVKRLADDVACWIEFDAYPNEEIAARFHHRLVEIHPFPNGNGRHARLATDLLCERGGWEVSSWGGGNLGSDGDPRRRYIEALRIADAGDIGALARFMRGSRG